MTETQQGLEQAEASDAARAHDVFVSYSRADRDTVVRLIEGLQARGLRAWVDLEDIPASAEWMSEIQAAIEAADGYLVVVSPDLASSMVCAQELEQAVASGKRIVPIVVRTTDPGSVPGSLAALHWIDATSGNLDAPLDAAVEALRTDLAHVKAHTSLIVRASEWQRKDETKALLLRGAEIGDAERLLASEADPRPTPLQSRFVLSSRAATTRRQRGLVGAVAAALIVSLGLSAIALVQRGHAIENERTAESQTQIANSRALASESLLNMDERLDVGMLLALESYRLSATPQAMDAVHVAAQRSAWIEHTFHHEEGVNALALSPSGEMLAEAGADGTVSLRDPQTGAIIGEPLAADEESVYAVAFDPASGALASGGDDGIVIVWDVDTLEQTGRFDLDGRAVGALAFANGGEVLIAGAGGKVHRWDLASRNEIGQPIIVKGGVSALLVDPTSDDVIVGTQDGELSVRDVRTGNETRSLPDASEVWGLAIDPDARLLAVATLARRTQASTGEIPVFDLRTGRRILRLQGHEDAAYSVAFSPDGDSIASGSADGTVRTWSVATGEPVGEPFEGHSDWVNAVVYAGDGRSMFSAGTDGTVIEWDVHHRLFGLGGPPNEVLFSPDGETMVTTEPIIYGDGGSVTPGGLIAWDPTRLERSATRTEAGAYGITLTSDGSQVVGTEVDIRTGQGSIVFLDLATLEELQTIDGPGDFLTSVGLGTDGSPIVAGGGSGDVYVWPTPDGAPQAEGGHGPDGFTYAIRFSPDRTMLATAALDGTVILRDPVTGEPEGEPLDTGLGGVYGLSFDADGERLAVGNFRGRVSVWNPHTRELLLDLELEDGAQSIAFSPDGTILAVGTTAGEVQMFEASTGERIGEPFAGQRDWVNSLAFSPEGELLASASEDGSILMLEPILWSVDIELLTQHLCAAAGRDLTEEEWGTLVGFAPYRSTCSTDG